MEIRIRETGNVVTEQEFRAYQQANDGPTWGQTTEEVLEALGADIVLEGPQALFYGTQGIAGARILPQSPGGLGGGGKPVQLVLQAAVLGKGGELFMLDMGEPVKIVDLAKEMIRLSGLSEQDVKIEFSGLRPGEKLFEELLMDDERTLPTPHPKLRIAKTTTRLGEEKFQALVDWIESEEPKSGEEVRKKLTEFLPESLPASINA